MNKPLAYKEVMIDTQFLAKRLETETSGEVMTDVASRGRYATDASIYQTMPVAVFVPKTAEDIVAAIQIAADLGVPDCLVVVAQASVDKQPVQHW